MGTKEGATVPAHIGSTACNALIDTGTTITFMRKSF